MTRYVTTCFAYVLFACATSAVFAGSSVESSLSDTGWLSTALEQISIERMLDDIRTLSGPAYAGRLTGSPQDEASAAFIANRFSELRLHRSPALPPENRTHPLPQREWKQTAPVLERTILGQSAVELVTPRQRQALKSGSQFLPILDSPSADIRGPVVFVGYGIVDPSSGIDDYAGIDARNAIVLFLRGKPETYAKSVTHADKERLAKQRGAVGYLTATGPVLSAYEQRRGVKGTPSAYYSSTASDDQLPGAWISTEIAEWILVQATTESPTLRSIQETLNRPGRSHSIRTEATVQMQWTSQVKEGTLFNVISVIRGYAPNNDEAVLLGAHRDHFGRQAGLLFAGADDNASGTAVLLEVARVLALAPAAPKRSVLFLSLSGEEQGLLGSKLYVSQPIVPLEKTTAMINVDHAGTGNGRLTVGVTGLEKSTPQRIGELTGLVDKLDLFGYFPGGDHVPFKEAGVPTVTVVSGGVHPHFHQPSDTAETVDPEILGSVARYVLALTWQLANDAP
jgi:hypothetical protein